MVKVVSYQQLFLPGQPNVRPLCYDALMNQCSKCPRPSVFISPDHTDLCVPCHGIKYRPARKARKIKSTYYPCS